MITLGTGVLCVGVRRPKGCFELAGQHLWIGRFGSEVDDTQTGAAARQQKTLVFGDVVKSIDRCRRAAGRQRLRRMKPSRW